MRSGPWVDFKNEAIFIVKHYVKPYLDFAMLDLGLSLRDISLSDNHLQNFDLCGQNIMVFI